MNNKSKIKACGRKILADRLEKTGHTWDGYDIYAPIYDEPLVIGLPSFVLAKGDNVRLTTSKEAFAIIDKYYSNNIG